MVLLLNTLSLHLLLFIACARAEKICITSNVTSEYPVNYKHSAGGSGKPCIFPFKVRGKTYHSCTFDSAHRTNYRPWCSTNVNEDGFHVREGFNWGICTDRDTCPIPPRSCGIPTKSRRASSDQQNNVEIEQQPWMVSLGEKLPGGGKNGLLWRHECGGSLITDRHVLTAAHCLFPVAGDKERRKKYSMLLGTSDFTNTSRYINIDGAFQIRKVEHINTHPLYAPPKPYWDVGIVVADRNIEFNDYIRPVCLPYRPNEDPDQLADQHVTLAGFGQFIDAKTGRVTDPRPFLKLATLQANSQYLCNRIFSPKNLRKKGIASFKRRQQIPYGIRNSVICAGNDFDITQTSCEGDSGGPVVRHITGGARAESYYEQAFIVSTGLSCKDLPAQIFVRVADRNVIRWIQDVTDTQPLLMVYGGYGQTDTSEGKKLLDSVELISTNKHFVCKKHISPISFHQDPPTDDVSIVKEETETQVMGSVGAFTQDAALFCGGENRYGAYNFCYEYLPHNNTWEKVKSMTKKRFLATSVHNNEKMWVIGGVSPLEDPSYTEQYVYKRSTRNRNRNLSKWKKGLPIPADLRDSGIQGHCTVQINDTYVFLAGGFAPKYEVIDPSIDRFKPLSGDTSTDAPDNPLLDITPKLPTIIEFLQLTGIYETAQRGKREAEDCFHCKEQWSVTLKGGGKALSKAWLYDGYYWVKLPDMPEPRDRAACSLLEKSDSDRKLKRQIILAGGCQGSCTDTPATTSVLVFDIEEWEKKRGAYEWGKVAPLPKPLSNAKMEVLEGLPTIIGGVDTNTKEANAELYQYYFLNDEWKNHTRLKMEIPRISPTVIEVPKNLFGYCFSNLTPPNKPATPEYFAKDKIKDKCYEDKDIYDIVAGGASPRSGLEQDESLVRSYRDKRQVKNKKNRRRRPKKQKCECEKPIKKICPPRCSYPKDEFQQTQESFDYANYDYESDQNLVGVRSADLVQDSNDDVCFEGDSSCCKKLCEHPNSSQNDNGAATNDGTNSDDGDTQLIQLRTDTAPCFEDDDCCKPPKKICTIEQATQSTTEDPSYEYAYEDVVNSKPIQLRTDSGPCYEGEECCEPPKKICTNIKAMKSTTEDPSYEYAYEDEVNSKPIELRTDSEPCYEGDECCEPVRNICKDPNVPSTTTEDPSYEYAYEDEVNSKPIQLRSDTETCYEGDECCNPPRKICIDPKVSKTTTESSSYEYAYDTYDSPKPIELRTDTETCYDGDECCNPPKRICRYLKAAEDESENGNNDKDYNYDENDIVNIFVRNDGSELCYEGEECCNNDIVGYIEDDDLNLIKLRSDSYNDYNCEELGISNIASIGDVSDGLLDIIDIDEEDANIVQLGVRTATQDCICKLPKKRCPDLFVRTNDDEYDEEEYDDFEVEATTQPPVENEEGISTNRNYINFPL